MRKNYLLQNLNQQLLVVEFRQRQFAVLSRYLNYYMKFLRHVNLAILRFVYFASLKFRIFK